MKHVVGIDLGTTNSLVAAVLHGRPRCLPVDEQGGCLLPSVVHYAPGGGVLVGQRARALAPLYPAETLVSIKRFMGRGPEDPELRRLGHHQLAPGPGPVVRFQVAGERTVTPIEVSAELLRTLKRRAEAQLGGKVEQAVITVPAYFDEAQRQATRDAGRVAGLEVLRLLNEPTAAALAYGLDKGSQGRFAVYDLGGGTFDVSLLELVEGVFQVKATGGDSSLGGDDFDRAIAQHALEVWGLGAPSPALVAELLAAARQAKEALSQAPEAELAAGPHRLRLRREDFEAWIAPLLQRTGAVCRRALKDAGLTPAELEGVLLVGGSTRVPAVRRFAAQLFGREPLGDIDPDQVVALGAAVQADLLTSAHRQDEILLLDVLPLSLGLETLGGVVERFIPRNTPLPTSASQVFTTFEDAQTGLELHVLQGERDLVEQCRSLARFRLSGIPPMAAGLARVEVSFQVDADGLLHVTAREQSTLATQSLTVRPSHGLTEEEVDRLLLEALESSEEDAQERELRELRVEAERVLARASHQLAAGARLLQEGERPALEVALEALREALQGRELGRLKACLHALDEASRPFAERIMSEAVRQVVAGRPVEEF